jgi:hypothetical protein
MVFQMAGKTGHGSFSSFGQPILDVFMKGQISLSANDKQSAKSG